MSLDLRPPASRRTRTDARAGPGPRRWRSRLARLDVKVTPYLFISPFYLVFLIFGAFPVGYMLWVSLHDRELATGLNEFVGLRNYQDLFGDSEFWNAVTNTMAMFVMSTVPQLLLALFLANALNRRMRGATLFRIGMIAPLITSTAAVAIVFTQMFDQNYGLINWALGPVGLGDINWQADSLASWTAISAMVDWRWTGYNALIYLASMQAIPRDLYEAAAIDGAGARRQFWQITVPMLRPTIIFTVIISTIGGLQLFTEPVLFGSGRVDGGNLGQYQTIAMYMFENAFGGDDYGYAAAISWLLFLIIIVFSMVNFLIIRRLGGAK